MKLRRAGALLLLWVMLVSFAGAEGAETVTFRDLTVSKDVEYINIEKSIRDTEWDKFYKFLAQLPNLKKVDMYSSTIGLKAYRKMSAICPDVEFGVQIRLGQNKVRTDVTAFSTLYAKANGSIFYSYDEIEMLTWCKNLYALDIGHHPVKKLDFLYELPELRVLVVALCELTDITPIASLEHLEYLEIFHNNITDISCLTNLHYLMDLDLVQNYIEDLSPLMEMKSLKRLWLFRNMKHDMNSPDMETVQKLQEALPDCFIEARGTSKSKGWVDHPHYQTIRKCFLSRQYEPFEDSDPENMPEPWRSEKLKELEEQAQETAEIPAEGNE